MSNDNNNVSMDPAVFEQFLKEIHDRLGDFAGAAVRTFF